MLNEKLLSEDIAGITKKANDYKAMGIITSRDLELIVAGLNLIKKDFEAGVDLAEPEDQERPHAHDDRALSADVSVSPALEAPAHLPWHKSTTNHHRSVKPRISHFDAKLQSPKYKF